MVNVTVQSTPITITVQDQLPITLSISSAQGPAGVGVPAGGTAEQVLAKVDSTDYNTYWKTGGGGGSSAAIDVTFTPGPLVSSTNVQAAIEEVAGNTIPPILKEIYGNTASTGWSGTIGITIADTIHFNVSAANGFIIYNTGIDAESPVINKIIYLGDTNVLVTNIATHDITYLLVNVSGLLYQQSTSPTPSERRDNLFIGRIVHPNRSTILAVINSPDFETSPVSQLRDMFTPMQLINNGIAPYADGDNLSFNILGGKLTGLGINGNVDIKNPNQITLAGKVPASFFYRTQTGGNTGIVSAITPGFYDNAGTITAIPTSGDGGANRSTNVRVYQFANGNVVCQYGQRYYSSLANAIAGIPSETFVRFSNVAANAVLIGVISVRRAATVLNNTASAIFTNASMFGEVNTSTNGISTTTLQQAYDNSATPEILTNAALGALSVKSGTVDTDTVIEAVNGAGVAMAAITADGVITGALVSTTGNVNVATGGLFTKNGVPIIDTTNTLAGDSDLYTASQKAVKYYIDTKDTQNVKLTGDQTAAGIKTFSSSPIVPTPTNINDAVNKTYTDSLDGANVKLTTDQSIAGIKTFSSSPIVPTPTIATQAANKSYADSLLVGTFWDNVAVATTASVNLASGLTNGTVIDTYTLVTGNRVLVKNQVTASQNGVYVVPASGAASRATDADTAAEVNNRKAIPLFGSQANRFYFTTSTVVNLGTDAISFAQLASSTYTSGTNIDVTGSTISTIASPVFTSGYFGSGSKNANAILDIDSTIAAFMPPRMTSAQMVAIPVPTAGMVIYNSSQGLLYVYNGSTWSPASSSSSATIVPQSSAIYNAVQTIGDIVILCDCTSNAITINLPTAVGNSAKFTVKKIAGNYGVTIDANGTETIDGFLTYPVSTINQSETIISNSANWFAL